MSKALKYSILGFLLFLYTFLLAQKINLVTADLGRHLVNGRLFFEKFLIPDTNLYSFSNPDFPFVNHHWGSGVVFYLIHQAASFEGLQIFFIALSLVTFLLFFDLARRLSSFEIASVASLLALPLLGSRVEIRPETFSYFFCGLFVWILFGYLERRLSAGWLIILPVSELFWVNLHIYFPFGIGLIGLVFISRLLVWIKERQPDVLVQVKHIYFILLVSVLMLFLNPFFAAGVVYPAKIFQNYGYRLLENQSIFFLDKITRYPSGLFFKLLFVVFILSWAWEIYRCVKSKRPPSLIHLGISLVFGYLGLSAVRNFAIFALFSLVVISFNLKDLQKQFSKLGNINFAVPALMGVLFLALLYLGPNYWQSKSNAGLGLSSGQENAVNFYLRENIQGPVFNNYDNGGFLIYYLYPVQRVFVDNRPEAYPAAFLQDTYIKMQEDDRIWQLEDKKWNFNSIFFYRHDLTPWAQKFLLSRVKDSTWAPVFVDNYSIIFLKRNDINKDLINKYELPQSMFQLRK